jgi:hypothetical protein
MFAHAREREAQRRTISAKTRPGCFIRPPIPPNIPPTSYAPRRRHCGQTPWRPAPFVVHLSASGASSAWTGTGALSNKKTADFRRFYGASRTRTGDLLGAISALFWPEFGLTSGFPSLLVSSPNTFPTLSSPFSSGTTPTTGERAGRPEGAGGDRNAGLSRRRSRVRVPSLPSLCTSAIAADPGRASAPMPCPTSAPNANGTRADPLPLAPSPPASEPTRGR